jgi:hypothetical protein
MPFPVDLNGVVVPKSRCVPFRSGLGLGSPDLLEGRFRTLIGRSPRWRQTVKVGLAEPENTRRETKTLPSFWDRISRQRHQQPPRRCDHHSEQQFGTDFPDAECLGFWGFAGLPEAYPLRHETRRGNRGYQRPRKQVTRYLREFDTTAFNRGAPRVQVVPDGVTSGHRCNNGVPTWGVTHRLGPLFARCGRRYVD